MLEGQAADLHSTYLAACPQEHEYLQMVDRSRTSPSQTRLGSRPQALTMMDRDWRTLSDNLPPHAGRVAGDRGAESRHHHDHLGAIFPDTRRLHEPRVR